MPRVFANAVHYPCVSLKRALAVEGMEPLVLSDQLSHSMEATAAATAAEAMGEQLTPEERAELEDATETSHAVVALMHRIAGTPSDLPMDDLPPRYPCLRIGALTVLRWGEIVVEAPWHSSHSIYPLGFLSRRIFWSVRNAWRRCVYTCEIVADAAPLVVPDGDDEDEAAATATEPLQPQARPVFVITCDEDQELLIAASSPDGALRQRVGERAMSASC